MKEEKEKTIKEETEVNQTSGREKLEEETEEEGIGFYEVAFLLLPDLNESLLFDIINQLRELIDSLGGKIVEEGGLPKKIRLAYPIEKNNFAYFGYLLFDCPKREIDRFFSEIKKNSSFLRYLLISKNKKYWLEDKKSQENWLRRKKKEEKTKVISEEELEKKLEEVLK